MPRKATGKRTAPPAQEQPPTTPAKKSRDEPTSTASTPVSIASSTASPASSSSAASSASSASSSSSTEGSVYRLRIELKYSSPPIWRRLLVHSSTTLHTMHRIIQVLFDWEDCHLHSFKLPYPKPDDEASVHELLQYTRHPERVFVDKGVEAPLVLYDQGGKEDTRVVTVGEVLHAVRDKLMYEYDFGDGWQHVIQVEAIEPATEANTRDLPRCTGGRLAAPVEDSGGIGRQAMMVHFYKEKKGLLRGRNARGGQAEQQQHGAEEHKQQQVSQPQQEEKAEEKEAASADHDDEEYSSEDDSSGYYEDEDDSPNVDEWLKSCSERIGRDYDPLRFDKKVADLELKLIFRDNRS